MHMLVIPQITLHNHYVTSDQHVRKTTDRHQPCEHLLPKLDLTGLKNQHQPNLAEDSSSLSGWNAHHKLVNNSKVMTIEHYLIVSHYRITNSYKFN